MGLFVEWEDVSQGVERLAIDDCAAFVVRCECGREGCPLWGWYTVNATSMQLARGFSRGRDMARMTATGFLFPTVTKGVQS